MSFQVIVTLLNNRGISAIDKLTDAEIFLFTMGFA